MKKILLGLLAFATLTATAADKKISDLTLLPAASFATGDLFSIVDVSASETKKTRILDLDTRYVVAPCTTTGSSIYYSLGVPTCLNIGAANTVKVSDGTSPSWAKLADANIATNAAITLSKLATLSISRAAVTDGSGVLSAATTTATEIGFVNGVTSALCGISQSCTQTNKTFTAPAINGANFNFGTASNSNRIVLPTDTTSNLAGYTNTAGLIGYDSTQGKVVYNNGVTWTAVGSGSGGGGINWILNPNAEQNTTGWNLYGVAGQNPPVDGSTTVGSVHVTWTRDLTSPLIVDSLGNFLFTKDAVNRQGEGASYDFTTDRSFSVAPGVHYIKFDYEAASGTFAPGSSSAEGDLTLWVYDKTNGVLIQPFVYRIPSQNGHYITWFQNNFGSSSYRFIVHTASTSASAFTMRFNRIKIEPAPATNPLVPQTLVFAYYNTVGTTVTTTNGVIKYTSMVKDTTGSYSTSTGLYTCPYSGVYRVTNYVNGSNTPAAGIYSYVGLNGSSEYARLVTPAQASGGFSSSANVVCNANSTLGVYSSSSTLAISNGASFAWVTFELIASGSSGAPVQSVGFTATGSTSVANNSQTTLTFASNIVDPTGAWNGTNTFTARGSGWYFYDVYSQAQSGSTVSAPFSLVQLLNGSNSITLSYPDATTAGKNASLGTNGVQGHTSKAVYLNDGNTLSFAVTQFSGSTQTFVGLISIVKLTSDAPINPNASQGGSWVSTDTTALTTNVRHTMTMGTTVKDYNGTMSAGVWTSQIPGLYQACGQVVLAPSVAGQIIDNFLTVGSQTTIIQIANVSAGVATSAFGCLTAPLTTGQTISMDARCTFGSGTCAPNTGALGFSGNLSIVRVGN